MCIYNCHYIVQVNSYMFSPYHRNTMNNKNLSTLNLYSILVAVMLALSATGCKKDSDPCPGIPDIFWGSAHAEYHGVIQEYHPYYRQFEDSENITIHLRHFTPCNYPRESIYFMNVRREIQFNDNLQAYSYSTSGLFDNTLSYVFYATTYSDVVATAYILDTTAQNVLEITRYDANTGEIEGNFQLRLVRDPEFIEYNPVPSAPDTILLTNGWFHTRESME